MPRPTEAMAREARRGLDWRAEFGRGGTEVGVARARDIVNRRDLSDETVARMRSFFARHEVDKEADGFRPGEEGYPSAGRIAWALWGGDPGQSWANAQSEAKMQYLNMSSEIKADGEPGHIEGYGSVFNIRDRGGDIVVKGAFSASLEERMPKMLYNHDPAKVIGMWDEAYEDERGLRLRGRINMDTQQGREVYSNLKMGALDGLSIGYRTTSAEPKANARMIKAADLYEVSVVSIPMNPQSTVDAVKAAEMSPSEMERRLRDAGCSRSVAAALMAGGWKAVQNLRDAGDGLDQLADFFRAIR